MRHAWARTATAVVAVWLGVGGCFASAADEPRPAEQPLTLAAPEDDTGGLHKLVAAWNADHPDTPVNLVELSDHTDELRQSMVQNFLARSSAYDVVSMDVTWTAEFASKGWITRLPEEEFPLDRYFASAVRTGKWEGELYAVPYTTDAGMLYYRSDLVDEPPRSWAELVRACRDVERPDEMACYAGQYATYEGLTANVAEAVHSAGGAILSPDGSEVVVDSPNTRRGLRFLARGLREGYIPRAAITFSEDPTRYAFQQGRLLFARNWSSMYGRTAAESEIRSRVGDRFEVAVLPGRDGPGTTTLGGQNLAVSNYSGRKGDAVAFLKYLTAEEAQRATLVEQSKAPVWRDLYGERALVERYPYLPVLKRSIAGARPRPRTRYYSAVSLAVQKETHAMLRGYQSVDRAVENMSTILNGVLEPR